MARKRAVPASRTRTRPRRTARIEAAPVPQTAPSRTTQPGTGGSADAWLLRLIFFVCVVLVGAVVVGLYLNSHRPVQVPASQVSATAPESQATLPPARSTLPEPVKAGKASPAPRVHEPLRRRANAAYHRSSTPGARVWRLASGAPLAFHARRSSSQGVEVRVFDSKYRSVRLLTEEAGKAGSVVLKWDGKDDQGQEVAPGTYYARVTQPGSETIQKIEVK